MFLRNLPERGETAYDRMIRLAQARMQGAVSVSSYIRESPYDRFKGDLVQFSENVFKEKFTRDIRRMGKSIQKNSITGAISANQTGKTYAAARFAVAFFLMYEDAQVYLTCAPPEENLKLQLWAHVSSLVEKHPHLFEGMKISLASYLIKRSETSFITGVRIPTTGGVQTRKGKFSGKHAPHLLGVFDEADAIPPEIYEAWDSCMSGGHARMLFTFNPRYEAGPTLQMDRDGIAHMIHMSAFTHPNVIYGREIIPGAVSQNVTVRRINRWTRPLMEGEHPDTSTFEIPEFLVGIVGYDEKGKPFPPLPAGHRKVEEPAFDYMVLGRYPSIAENQLIARDWVDRAISRWVSYVSKNGPKPPPYTRPVLGLDVSELGKDLNVLTARYGSFVQKQRIWAGIEPDHTGEKAADHYHELDAVQCNVDATGVGAGAVRPMRKRNCKSVRIMLGSSPDPKLISQDIMEIGEFDLLRDQIFWLLRDWLKYDAGAMIPPDEKLREELLALKYGKHPRTGKIKVTSTDVLKEVLKRSPDRATSLALTFAPVEDQDLTGGGSFSYI